MKICQQVLLVTQESCANVTFESCELFILQCALPQLIQLVGKTTLTVCTHENSGCNHIHCNYRQFDVVLWIHGYYMTKCICNWNVYSFLVHNFEWQVWGKSDYESLYPWTNVNHMLLVNTYTSGFWSVSNVNSFPYRKKWNFSIPQIVPSASLSKFW